METLCDEGEPLEISLHACGYAWDDEWLEEILEDPTQLEDNDDLAAFIKVLWMISVHFGEVEGRKMWNTMQKRFGYPCKMPKYSKGLNSTSFNWPYLFETLKKADLGEFERAFNLALCDTGNPFLDICQEEYDADPWNDKEFTSENIHSLKTEWAEAQIWLADYEKCRQCVVADPTIYARLVCVWEKASKHKLPPVPPKTLSEIFMEDIHDDTPNPIF